MCEASPAVAASDEVYIEEKAAREEVVCYDDGDRGADEAPFEFLSSMLGVVRHAVSDGLTQTKAQFMKAFRGAQNNKTQSVASYIP
jgi:hypothetical protein